MQHIIFRTIILSLFFTIISGFIKRTESIESLAHPPFFDNGSVWVDSVMKSLTLEEKIAQLVMVAAYPNKDSVHYKVIQKLVKDYNIGGIIVFQGGPVKTASMINLLQSEAKTPMIVGIDGEWGLSMRLDSTLVYPKQMSLGAIPDNRLIYKMGKDIAWQLRRMGLHTNFSPVVDINNNAKNPVIGMRSFGESREKVAQKGYAYMLGLQEGGLLATAKHFPGHGDTDTDSHLALPMLNQSAHRIDSLELHPFKYLIKRGLSGVMVAHLNVPSLDSTDRPSTLSRKIIDSLLIHDLEFEGLIFTDALNMKGVSSRASDAVIAVEAFLAGNDILLMPSNPESVIKALKLAADSSVISSREIERRCRKVLMAKYWLGLNNYKPVELKGLYEDLHKPEFELTRRQLVESSLTILKNDSSILPIKRLDTLKIAAVSVGDSSLTVFQTFQSLYANIDYFSIDRNASDSAYNVLYQKLKSYNLLITGLLNTDIRAAKLFGVTDKSIEFLHRLADSSNVILDVFASPYVMERFGNTSKFKAIVMSYEDKPLNHELSAQLLFGGVPAIGTLPVKANDYFLAGTGIRIDSAIRFKYTIPEELGISTASLFPIDSLVNDAITKKAMPGCQIFLAKEGKVFFNKSYGYFTYDSTRAISNTDIYDLASITKMAATTPTLMRLYDEKKFSLTDKMSKYLPFLAKTNKSKILIKDVLTHQARLFPWSPLYIKAIRCEDETEKLISKEPSGKIAYKIADLNYINCNTKLIAGGFSKEYSAQYPNKMLDSVYTNSYWHDTVLTAIANSPLLPKQIYKYSDFGFILLKELVDRNISSTFDKYTDSIFYKSMGAKTLCFKPTERFEKSNIAPTENDKVFRKTVVQGYVHDPTAALLGGVSGHAGLFGNANDLAKLMQMYVNKGVYGGQRYISESTVTLFTSRPVNKIGNRRGLGFDKPEPDTTKNSPVSRYCSDLSYGHTGFTGIMAWADPQYKFVYVFLSNRVYPDAAENKLSDLNLRTNIQDVVYKLFLNQK